MFQVNNSRNEKEYLERCHAEQSDIKNNLQAELNSLQTQEENLNNMKRYTSVSYTHLTLPTIYSV